MLLEGKFLSAQGHRAPSAPPQAATPFSLPRSPALADAQPGPAAARSPAISPENLLPSRGSPTSGEPFALFPTSLVRVSCCSPGLCGIERPLSGDLWPGSRLKAGIWTGGELGVQMEQEAVREAEGAQAEPLVCGPGHCTPAVNTGSNHCPQARG